ncbi:unnamed protein product [Lampetra planeri]
MQLRQKGIKRFRPSCSLPGHPAGHHRRGEHSRLAELLHTAASSLQEIHHGEPTVEGRAGLQATAISSAGSGIPAQDFESPCEVGGVSARSREHHGTCVTSGRGPRQSAIAAPSAARPAQEAAILLTDGGAVPAKSDEEHLLVGRVPAIHQRLPVLKEFSVAGGDWVNFQCRFLSHREMAGGWRKRRYGRSRPPWTTTPLPLSSRFHGRIDLRCNRRCNKWSTSTAHHRTRDTDLLLGGRVSRKLPSPSAGRCLPWRRPSFLD